MQKEKATFSEDSKWSREKSIHQQRVEKFMALAKQEIPSSPIMPNEKTRELRAKLILEEALETVRDLGFSAMFCPESVQEQEERWIKKDNIVLFPNGKESLKNIADGCADIIVVTTGTLSACGLSDMSVQKEVDDNNLAKFGPGHSFREDGKLIKPPDHKPPKLQQVIDLQIEESKNAD